MPNQWIVLEKHRNERVDTLGLELGYIHCAKMRDLSRRIPIRGRGYKVGYQACGPLLCNIYALICETTGETAIVDPSCETSNDWDDVLSFLRPERGKFKSDLDVQHIFLTHGHADHVLGVTEAMKRWPSASLFLHPLEEENYREAHLLGKQFGMKIPASLPAPTEELHDGCILNVGETIRMRVVHTPGHSPGHVAFADNRPCRSIHADSKADDGDCSGENSLGAVIIGGDLLFRGTVGHTEMPNASFTDLTASLCRLYDMFHEDSIVLSGHTTPTWLKTEKESNRYVISALQRPKKLLEEAKQRHGWKI